MCGCVGVMFCGKVEISYQDYSKAPHTVYAQTCIFTQIPTQSKYDNRSSNADVVCGMSYITSTRELCVIFRNGPVVSQLFRLSVVLRCGVIPILHYAYMCICTFVQPPNCQNKLHIVKRKCM